MNILPTVNNNGTFALSFNFFWHN